MYAVERFWKGRWWATRRSSRSLPNGASRTVGDVRWLDELDSLIEADEAFLAEHSYLAPA